VGYDAFGGKGGGRRESSRREPVFSRLALSPWESAKWSTVPIITSSFYGNNAEEQDIPPKDIEREKITRTDDSRSAGGREKQPHNFASCMLAELHDQWNNSIILPSVSRISLC